MLKLAVGALVGIPALMTVATLGTGVMIVDVQDHEHRIVVPVPLLAAQFATAFIPDHHVPPIDLPEEVIPAARRIVEELADAPDGELVRVEERDELVSITKVGDVLEVLVVEGDRTEVSVNVPLESVIDLLIDAEDGLTPYEAVAAVRAMRMTRLADVRDGDERVRISIW